MYDFAGNKKEDMYMMLFCRDDIINTTPLEKQVEAWLKEHPTYKIIDSLRHTPMAKPRQEHLMVFYTKED